MSPKKLGKRGRSNTEEPQHKPFLGHLCTWCKGTPGESTRWETHGALVRHARAVHLREGKPWPTTALYPPTAGPNVDDVTDVLPDQLLWSEFNLPAAMGYLDGKLYAQEIQGDLRAKYPRSRNEHGQRTLPYLLEADGTPARGPRGDLLLDIPGLPRRISSMCEHWRLEALCRTCPDAVFTDFRDRIPGKKMLEHGAFTNKRKRYRADSESAQGRVKGFVMATMIDRAGVTIPLLSALDALSPRQKANGTTWDVLRNGLIAQPAPRNLCQGEKWNPIPIKVKYPYKMSPVLEQAQAALEKAKKIALSKGIHWTAMGKDELKEIGIGGKFGTSTKGEKARLVGDGKYRGKNYKISELRQFLRDRGISDKGNNKRELIQRLEENDDGDSSPASESSEEDEGGRFDRVDGTEDEGVQGSESTEGEDSESERYSSLEEDDGSEDERTETDLDMEAFMEELEAAASYRVARQGYQSIGDDTTYSTESDGSLASDEAPGSPERSSFENNVDVARQQSSETDANWPKNVPNQPADDVNAVNQLVDNKNAPNQSADDANVVNQLADNKGVLNQSADDANVVNQSASNADVRNQPAGNLWQVTLTSFPVMANWTNHSLHSELETLREPFEEPVFDLEEDPLIPRWVEVRKGEHRHEPIRLRQVTPEMSVYRLRFFTGGSHSSSDDE
jgi:SAP domain